ncbi:hypothetical protein ACFQZC_09590 [Streptacidiphilus monticola]
MRQQRFSASSEASSELDSFSRIRGKGGSNRRHRFDEDDDLPDYGLPFSDDEDQGAADPASSRRATAGPPGTGPPRRRRAPSPDPTGWSPNWPPWTRSWAS